MSFRLKVAVAFGLSFLLLAGVLLYVIGFLPSPKEPGKPADLKQAPPQVAVPAPDPVVEPAETIAIQAVEEKAPEPEEESGRPLLKQGGWQLRGRVVRDQNAGAGQSPSLVPVAGAAVYLKPHPRNKIKNPLAIQKRVTGSDGRFEFDGVPPEWLQLWLDTPPYAIHTVSFSFGDAGADRVRDLGDLILHPGVDVAFKVVGPEEEPVENAQVLVRLSSTNPRTLAGAADGVGESRRYAEEKPDGLYVLERTVEGNLRVEVKAPGYAPHGSQLFSSPEEASLDAPLFIQLEPGHRIAGTVVTTEGEPIAAALLKASGDETRSDDVGRFLLSSLSQGQHTVEVEAEGFASARQENVATGTEDLRIELAPEAVFFGRVLSQEEESPVSRANVTLQERDGSRKRTSAKTDDAGEFRVTGLSEGTFTVMVDHEKFAAKVIDEPVKLKTAEENNAGTIYLNRGLTATGKVVDSETGVGIAEAEISLRLNHPEVGTISSRRATSQADGSFELAALNEGEYAVDVKAKGYFALERQSARVSQTEERHFVLTLELGSKVSGRVVDTEGQPIAAATVRPDIGRADPSDYSNYNMMWTRFRDVSRLTTKTDSDGRYLLEGLKPYATYGVHASHPDYAETTIEGLSLDARATVEGVDIVLVRGGAIEGRVTGPEGEGVAAIRVRSFPTIGRSEWMFHQPGNQQATTDEGGYYRLQGLMSGKYTVRAEPSSGDLSGATAEGVVVNGEETTKNVDLELSLGETVVGKVIDADGNPIASVQIYIFEQRTLRTETDAEGTFQLAGVPRGNRYIQASKRGYLSKHENITVPQEETVITLEQGAIVKGRVYGPDKKPLQNIHVTAVRVGQGPALGTSARDDTGEFNMDLRDGTYFLAASANGYAPTTTEEFIVRAGDEIDDIEIELEPGGEVVGSVVERGGGAPVSNATVALAPSGQEDRYLSWGGAGTSAVSRADGTFTLRGLPIGSVSLRASHPNYAPTTLSGVIVRESDATELRIEVGRGGEIRGWIHLRREPIPGVQVSLQQNESGNYSWKSTTSDADGRFEFQGLAAGTYMLYIDHAGVPRQQNVVVREGETTDLELEAQPTVRVAGQIRSGGQPLSGGRIQAMNPQRGWGGASEIDGAGRYKIDLPGAGDYSLLIFAQRSGSQGTRVAVTVPQGRSEVDFDIDLPAGEIVGVVVDRATGQPVAGAQVAALAPGARMTTFYGMYQAMQSMATTDARGRFALTYLPAGNYTVRVFTQEYAEATVDGIRLRQGMRLDSGEIALNRGVGLSVAVISEDGKPVGQALAVLRDESGGLAAVIRPVTSGADGTLQLTSIEPGIYKLTIVHTDYAPSSVSLQIDADTPSPTVVLEPGGGVEIRVVDSRGRSVEGSEVFLRDKDGHNVLEDQIDPRSGPVQVNLTDRRGTLVRQQVKAGKYEAVAELGDRSSQRVEVTVSRDDTVAIELELSDAT